LFSAHLGIEGLAESVQCVGSSELQEWTALALEPRAGFVSRTDKLSGIAPFAVAYFALRRGLDL